MRTRLAIASAAAVLLALAAAGSAQAALTVTNQKDSGAGSLRQAVAEAGPGETINLPAGTYTLASGPLQVTKALTISGHAAGDTTIRAGGAFRVIESTGEFVLGMNDLTIRDGVLVTPAGILSGAAIRSAGTELALTRVTVTGNKAIADGLPGGNGGIVQGGAIYVSGAALILSGSTVAGNIGSANGGSEKNGGIIQGGAIYVSGAALILSGSTVSGNTTPANGGSESNGGIVQGGGIFVVSGSLAISNSTIADNPSSVLGGPGPSNAAQNGGSVQGGGLFVIQNKEPSTLAGTTISGNSSDVTGGLGAPDGSVQGGGLFSIAGKSSLSVANSTIASNTGRTMGPSGGIVQGAGVFVIASKPGIAAFLSTTLNGNRVEAQAPSGSGNLYASGPLSLRNSIISNGGGAKGTENCEISPEGTVSLGFNLDSLNQCQFTAPGDLVEKDPLLGPLQSNGGLTATLAPAANSPVVDQGAGFGLAADQRSLLRPVDLPAVPNATAPGADGADIGAVEVQLQPQPVQFSNGFTLGKLTKNKKKGTASLVVHLPQPSGGTLMLTGKGVETRALAIAGQAQVALKVVGRKSVRKALRKRGRRKVEVTVTYSPPAASAKSLGRKINLVKKRKSAK